MLYVSSAKRIQLSEEAQKALEAFACYKMIPRGEVVVKVRIFRRLHRHWEGGLIVIISYDHKAMRYDRPSLAKYVFIYVFSYYIYTG